MPQLLTCDFCCARNLPQGVEVSRSAERCSGGLLSPAPPHSQIFPRLAGTLYTGAIHIFCGIVGKLIVLPSCACMLCWTQVLDLRCPDPPAGAGVLALPRSLGWLGWVAGPLLIIAFYFMSLTAAW